MKRWGYHRKKTADHPAKMPPNTTCSGLNSIGTPYIVCILSPRWLRIPCLATESASLKRLLMHPSARSHPLQRLGQTANLLPPTASPGVQAHTTI